MAQTGQLVHTQPESALILVTIYYKHTISKNHIKIHLGYVRQHKVRTTHRMCGSDTETCPKIWYKAERYWWLEKGKMHVNCVRLNVNLPDFLPSVSSCSYRDWEHELRRGPACPQPPLTSTSTPHLQALLRMSGQIFRIPLWSQRLRGLQGGPPNIHVRSTHTDARHNTGSGLTGTHVCRQLRPKPQNLNEK